eukprot:TRINITY_DN5990_c0_g1_i1.p1 TRINITY_DN5990_c0_g1~~TRINITY_DN5990_c0_g1_i1.p1  ORF type:complete len:398 (+),score=95.10 TRINITY_DN5990_c0_g1_i1:36-1229(+)
MEDSASPALSFKVLAKCGRARVAELSLPHHTFETPVFMPVGTQGTIKGLTTKQIEALDCPIILGNTYHLGHRPGGDVLKKMGGLHCFMNWKRNILTDSGGFQMVSLLKLAEITEEGVTFQSPHDGSTMILTPEKSMQLQNQIGADIMMALDDVVSSTTTGPRVEEAMHRTIRWIDRCIAAHSRPKEQNLFGIVQGGLDPKLREQCAAALVSRNLPGYAIGGLSGGEEKTKFWKVVAQCAQLLPENKPRYLMGVGYPVDLVVCVCLGVDMFDCVFPTRTARFGTALVNIEGGMMHLKKSEYQNDFNRLDDECDCMVCEKYTRAYLHGLVTGDKDMAVGQLLSYHNISYQMRLMRNLRNAILAGKLENFVQDFFLKIFPRKMYPVWATDALTEAGITLL